MVLVPDRSLEWRLGVRNHTRISEGELERLVMEAIRGDALRYLATILNMTRAHDEISSDTLSLDEITSPEWNLVHVKTLCRFDVLPIHTPAGRHSHRCFRHPSLPSFVACDMPTRIQA
ncbi:hypothetical protein RhiJN_27357 [Ceratobasidium sp. AG-Ba]|nr:hypothetical protein RhiJN_27357 [Ceratobasidium sp. AG-Ba]